jgi:transcriptional regulator with XRE-family HTH domain
MDQARDAVSKVGDHDDKPDVALASIAVIKPATASARLRAAREARGLTTADIAARTRITLRHVEAIDRGAFAELPGRPYVLGFVRNYARVVGLDEGDLAALARSELDAGVPRVPPRVVHQFDVDDPAKTPSRLVTWLALALFIVVLAAVGVFWRSYYAPASDLPSLVQPDPTPTPAPAAPAVKPAPTAAGPVVFTAREDGVWVKFYDGQGRQLMQKQLAMGESYTVPADAVGPRLWTGRPDALAITIGGQAVPPLSDHRGIVRDIPVTAQALLARGQPVAAGAAPAAVTGAGSAPRTSHHRSHRADSDAGDTTGVASTPADAAPVPAPAPAPAAAASAGGAQ